MSETQSPSTPRRSEAASEPAEASSKAQRGNEPLSSELGSTTIADAVVTKIASIAAREVSGVHDLGGGTARAIGGVTRSVGRGIGVDERMQGVGVEVGEREAAVDLTVVVEYGESIPRIAGALRDNITRRIEGMTGLTVTEVNIAVNDLYFSGDEAAAEPARVE